MASASAARRRCFVRGWSQVSGMTSSSAGGAAGDEGQALRPGASINGFRPSERCRCRRCPGGAAGSRNRGAWRGLCSRVRRRRASRPEGRLKRGPVSAWRRRCRAPLSARRSVWRVSSLPTRCGPCFRGGPGRVVGSFREGRAGAGLRRFRSRRPATSAAVRCFAVGFDAQVVGRGGFFGRGRVTFEACFGVSMGCRPGPGLAGSSSARSPGSSSEGLGGRGGVSASGGRRR